MLNLMCVMAGDELHLIANWQLDLWGVGPSQNVLTTSENHMLNGGANAVPGYEGITIPQARFTSSVAILLGG